MDDETASRGSLLGLGGLANLCCVGGGASAATAGTAGIATGTVGVTAGVVSVVPTLLALAVIWFVLGRRLSVDGQHCPRRTG